MRLPAALLARLQRGPFGRKHLVALAEDLARATQAEAVPVARFAWPVALARNVLLYPVVLAHAIRVIARR